MLPKHPMWMNSKTNVLCGTYFCLPRNPLLMHASEWKLTIDFHIMVKAKSGLSKDRTNNTTPYAAWRQSIRLWIALGLLNKARFLPSWKQLLYWIHLRPSLKQTMDGWFAAKQIRKVATGCICRSIKFCSGFVIITFSTLLNHSLAFSPTV